MKFLLVFINIFITVVLSKGNSVQQKIERSWKAKKQLCERTTCNMYNIDEGMNCVYKCLSSECYSTIYGDNPLEDGEIDVVRYRTFQNCVRKEYKKVLTENRIKGRKQMNDKTL